MLNLFSLGTILSLKRNCEQILEGKQRVLWYFESGLLDIEREPDKENDIYEESDDRDGEESNTGLRPGKENDIYHHTNFAVRLALKRRQTCINSEITYSARACAGILNDLLKIDHVREKLTF